MKPPDLEKLRLSGRISATAREHGKSLIKAGAKLAAIAEEVETMIFDLGGRPAFPAQLSRNHVAAHDCSPPGDPSEIQPGDIVKLDLGTHVDGYVTDNAVTVDLKGGPNSALVAASAMALENAISVMGPGASITAIGEQIETTIKAFGFSPIYNLTGHGVARYVIHCAPSIPNYPDPKAARLRPNQTIACEPFACDGRGYIEEEGEAQVFGLERRPKPKDRLPPRILETIEALEGLPFARRSLLRLLGEPREVERTLELLRRTKLLRSYPPLVERRGVRVAQTEHTIFIGENGAEVLTRTPAHAETARS
ncbi:MAG: type II methionyl aminopeptidase [Planctomycetes bacterium]|nr:type II methionyl aminopeptidase [Planctomycetota bacterium]